MISNKTLMKAINKKSSNLTSLTERSRFNISTEFFRKS